MFPLLRHFSLISFFVLALFTMLLFFAMRILWLEQLVTSGERANVGLTDQVDGALRRLLIGIVLGFTLMYALLYVVVRRADRILHRQYDEIEENEEILSMKNRALEQAIAAREHLEKQLSAARAKAESHKHVFPVVEKMCSDVARVFIRYVGREGRPLARRAFRQWLSGGATGPVSVPNYIRALTALLPADVDRHEFEREAFACIALAPHGL